MRRPLRVHQKVNDIGCIDDLKARIHLLGSHSVVDHARTKDDEVPALVQVLGQQIGSGLKGLANVDAVCGIGLAQIDGVHQPDDVRRTVYALTTGRCGVGRGFCTAWGMPCCWWICPSHGASAGDHITYGLNEAKGTRAALAYPARELPAEKVGVIGVSLGAASLVLARPEVAPAAVVLEPMFPTIEEAVADRLTTLDETRHIHAAAHVVKLACSACNTCAASYYFYKA